MLARVVEVDALHPVDLPERVKKPLRLPVGEVCGHELCRAVGDELLFHHVQALLGGGTRGQVGGQIVFHRDPAAGEDGEGDGDAHQQEDQIALIHDERGYARHHIG